MVLNKWFFFLLTTMTIILVSNCVNAQENSRLEILLGEYGQAMFADTAPYPTEGGRDFYVTTMCGDGTDGVYMIPNTTPRGLYHWKTGEKSLRLVLSLTKYHYAYEEFDGFDAVILTPEQLQENQEYIWQLIEEDGILYGIAPDRGRLMRFTGDGWVEAGIVDLSSEKWTTKPQYFYSDNTRYPFVKMGNYLYFLQTTETSTDDSRNLAMCDLRTGLCTVLPYEFAHISAYKPGKLLVMLTRRLSHEYGIFSLDEMCLERTTITLPGNSCDYGSFHVYDRANDQVLIVDNEEIFTTRDMKTLQPIGVMPAAILDDYMPTVVLSGNLLCVAGTDAIYVNTIDPDAHPGKTVHVYDIYSSNVDHGQYLLEHPDKPVARPRSSGLYLSVASYAPPTYRPGDVDRVGAFSEYSITAIANGANDIDVYALGLDLLINVNLSVDLSVSSTLKAIAESLDCELHAKLVVDGKLLAIPTSPECTQFYFVNPNSENTDAAVQYITYMVSRKYGM